MWRVRGKIPHSVDSSANILEVLLNDKQSSLTSSKLCLSARSENELKLMYSMCIVRAVNGLVEPSQHNYYAISIMNIANQIGLPSWFVDLRHDSTHGNLPSLYLLKYACNQLLLWYKINYWEQQEIYLNNITYSCLHYNQIIHEKPSQSNEKERNEIMNNSTELNVLFSKDSSFLSNIFYPFIHQSVIQTIEEVTEQSLQIEQPSTSSSSTSSSTSFLSFDSTQQQQQQQQQIELTTELYNKQFNKIIKIIYERFNKLLSDTLTYNKSIIHLLLTSLTVSIFNYILYSLKRQQITIKQINVDLYFNVMNYLINLIINNYRKMLKTSSDLSKRYKNNVFVKI